MKQRALDLDLARRDFNEQGTPAIWGFKLIGTSRTAAFMREEASARRAAGACLSSNLLLAVALTVLLTALLGGEAEVGKASGGRSSLEGDARSQTRQAIQCDCPLPFVDERSRDASHVVSAALAGAG
jgi:hypothetical protein